jgi:hypothetical protein
VLQPYQLVKDLRTGAAALSQKVTGEKVDVEDVD